MAIVTMKKFTLVALDCDKQALYDEMIRTGCVELTESAEVEQCFRTDSTAEIKKLQESIAAVEEGIDWIDKCGQIAKKQLDKQQLSEGKGSFSQPLFEVTFDQFKGLEGTVDETFSQLNKLLDIKRKYNALQQQIEETLQLIDTLRPYLTLRNPFTFYKDTDSVFYRVGTVSEENYGNFKALFTEDSLAEYSELIATGKVRGVEVMCHKSESAIIESLERGLLDNCKFSDVDVNAVQYNAKLNKSLEGYRSESNECLLQCARQTALMRCLKLYVDYFTVKMRQCNHDDALQNTAETFVMQGFFPAENQQRVTDAIYSVTDGVVLNIDDIKEGEFAPTLNKNNKFVRSFETITNTYTPPNYHEPDPNPVMSVFYFLIFGLMTADIGYGLVLSIVGLFVASRIKQRTGMKSLLTLIGYCGFSTILWGVIYGSLFSVDLATVIPNCPDWYPLLPSPSNYPIITMIVSLALGIVHLMAGVACNAHKLATRRDAAGVIFDALIWEVFFAGVILLALKPACDMIMSNIDSALKQPQILVLANVPDMTMIGLYIIAGALVVVLLTAGRGRKGIFGKILGGFGGVYGVINYFSDIVSYVRIFGLMLSGAVFGFIINQIGQMIMTSAIGYVLAIVLYIFAHLFNLALAVLGAYVHDSRLQYVEFFGKFYEGEGQLFAPLGSGLNYTLIK